MRPHFSSMETSEWGFGSGLSVKSEATKYRGLIKSFNPQKGWGFIECEQTQQIYGKDMFVLKNALPGGVASKGDEVCFTVMQEHNGPVAAEVEMVRRASSGSVPIVPPQRLKVPPSMGFGMASPAPVLSGDLDSRAGFVGSVKSFNVDTGWGMIASPEMLQRFGKDIFFSKSVVQGGGFVAQGEQVFFTIKMEAKGPAAASVQVLYRPPHPGLANPMPVVNRFPQPSGAQVLGMRPRMPAKDQTFFGILKSFNEDKGWGHITCSATSRLYGKDVFLMRGALNGQLAQQGQLLSFKVNMGAKGPQASNVAFLPAGSFHVNGEEPTIFRGHVKSFNSEKGWGFVTSEDLQQIFGKDIFIHKRELDGRTPSPGEEVQLSVEIDEGGQPVGRSLSGPMHSYAPGREVKLGANAWAAPY